MILDFIYFMLFNYQPNKVYLSINYKCLDKEFFTIQQILETKENINQNMGQQCSNNNAAQSFQFKRGTGIKITGNNDSIYSNKKNNSVYHFQKSTIKSQLNHNVQKIQSSLGNFQHSQIFKPPKGNIQSQSYVLNQQGLVYKQNGQWKNGMPHGRGQMIYPDGSYYVGYIQNGIPHGQGRFISSDGWYYQGQLKNQQAQGRGKFVYDKYGFQYEGNWAADLPDGFGRQVWRNNNGQIVYQGQFLNGIKHGNGKYTTPYFTYQGRFQKNTLNGKGKVVYKNGQIYEGDFMNGKKNGHGIYRWPDHSQFQGTYEDDLKHGLGKFTNPTGKIFQGKWNHGKRQGQGVIISKNKKHYFDWKNNMASPQKRQKQNVQLRKTSSIIMRNKK